MQETIESFDGLPHGTKQENPVQLKCNFFIHHYDLYNHVFTVYKPSLGM